MKCNFFFFGPKGLYPNKKIIFWAQTNDSAPETATIFRTSRLQFHSEHEIVVFVFNGRKLKSVFWRGPSQSRRKTVLNVRRTNFGLNGPRGQFRPEIVIVL